MNNDKVTLGKPTIELGENRYLRHYIFEILVGDEQEVAGFVFSTRYFYQDAKADGILRTWMTRPDTYTEHNQMFMLDPSTRFAELPVALDEQINHQYGEVHYLDEVTAMPEYRNLGVEHQVVKQWRDLWSSQSDALIVPDFSPISRYIEGINAPPKEFWGKLGFKLISEHFMVSEGSLTYSRKKDSPDVRKG